ncbi:MAG: CotH kinase family protein, partial [Bacteroidia bacterium]|nr:CotH kinase family protein [Bacteroidia bacterium]
YNMREKVNRYFLDTYYDIDRDSIDLLEGRYLIKSGYRTEYLKLIRYLRNNDLSSEEHYAYIKSKIDVESFTDFIITQIFVNNRDAGGNVKYWRVQDETSKWRWILYDTDFGFGLHNPKGYRENALEFFTEANGPKYPNPPWSTIWLRSLLKNEDFRNHFINRFQDHLNTTFRTDRMLKHLYSMVDLYDPEISRHLKKWNLSKKRRDLHLAIMERFALRRPDYMYNDLSEYFDLGDLLKVVIAPHDNGDLVLNQHLDIVEPFEGRYFQKTKIRLQAYPYYGFRFSHWEGLPEHITQHNIVVSLEKYDSLSIRPVFEPYTHSITGRVIFNEINAYSQDIGDWVEIFNTSNEIVDIGNWIITDLRNEYHLPNMFINPGEYVVVCQDTTLFRKKFGSTDFNIVGNLPFGINKRKEYIALYDADGASVDSLSYDIEPIDSSFTLNLLLPHLDNSDIENWEIRPGLGTPNAENPYVLESRIREKQMMWMRSGSVIGFVFILLFMLLFHKRLEKL